MSLPSCDFLKFSHCFFSPCYTWNGHALNFHQEPDLPTTCSSGVPAAPTALAAACLNHLLTSAAVLTSHPSYTSVTLSALIGVFYLISKWPNHHFLPSTRDDGVRKRCRLRRQAAWFNPDSLLASFFTSLKPTFPQAVDKDNHSTYFRVFSDASMSNVLKALNPVRHTGNANINNKYINNDDKQVSLQTNSNLQSRRFSRTPRFIFLLSPMSFSLKNTDFSFDVCYHPSCCNSFKTSQLAGFNGIHFPDCTLHWDTALPHPGVRETEQTLLGSQLCFLLAQGPQRKPLPPVCSSRKCSSTVGTLVHAACFYWTSVRCQLSKTLNKTLALSSKEPTGEE